MDDPKSLWMITVDDPELKSEIGVQESISPTKPPLTPPLKKSTGTVRRTFPKKIVRGKSHHHPNINEVKRDTDESFEDFAERHVLPIEKA